MEFAGALPRSRKAEVRQGMKEKEIRAEACLPLVTCEQYRETNIFIYLFGVQ